MINALILYLLQVNGTTGVSVNLLDSAGTGLRVYHDRIFQGHAYPAVVFKILNQTPIYKKGAMALQEPLVTFLVHHPSDTEANTIATNLIEILEGWQGDHGGKNWKYTTLERQLQAYNDDLQLHTAVVDFNFCREN